MKELFKNKKFIMLLSFFVPIFLLFIIFIFAKIFPFGNNTLFIWDCNGQYIDYLAYFKSIFFDNNNFFYTFSKTLGGDMIGLSSYYLLSPLNFIFLLCPNEYLYIALFIVISIKIGLCGLTFFIFLNKTYNKYDYKQIIFSTTYALSGYVIAYFWNIMWLEGVILLPMVILGINKIIDSNKPLIYFLSLSIMLITNYYIGFMITIFSAIYFLYKIINTINYIQELKKYIKNIISYISFSLLSILTSSFILIPTFLSLKGGKAEFSLSTLTFTENFGFMDIFVKLFTNTLNYEHLSTNVFPNIFCGILALVLVLLYFLNSKIKTKEKILDFSILLVLLMSFHVNAFNLIWHGFNPPCCFSFRYSFIFCFLLIWIAYKGLINLKTNTKKNFYNCFFIFIIFCVLILKNYLNIISLKTIYFDVFIFIVFLIALYYIIHRKLNKNILYFIIIFFNFVDILFNNYYSVQKLKDINSNLYPTYLSASDYTDYVKTTSSAINKIKQYDSSFYRIEKNFKRSYNDSMQFNYRGLTHFSSCEKASLKEFMRSIGFRYNHDYVFYSPEYTQTIDSLFGVKYLLTKKNINKNYEKLFIDNNISVYKNPYALPIGLAVSSDILNSQLPLTNPFEMQNTMLNSMTSEKDFNIFTPAEIIETNFENLNLVKENNIQKYSKINNNKEAYLEYRIKINNSNKLYLDFPDTVWFQKADLFINNKLLNKYFGLNNNHIIDLGNFNIGDTISIKLTLNENTLEFYNSCFYYENIENLEKKYNYLTPQFCDIKELSSSHLTGSVNVSNDNQNLFFTIPYEKGWDLFIDGKKANLNKTFDIFMSAPISKGLHTFELKYIPEGFYLGITISSLSLCFIFSYIIYQKKYKHKN